MDQFHGLWTQESCDNVDAFLSAIGIGWGLRTVAKTQSPSVEFSTAEDGTITFKTMTTFKTDEQKFQLGEEYEETRLDSKIVKTTANIENGALVFHKKGDKKEYSVTFSVEGDKLTSVYVVDNIKSVRILKRA
ncbi:hypothetical protein QQS21_010113 [Conoideocrella luteorostrata]|uniref:Lipocalin/cytosolic fatty-acid binding domain-containing protein n=1 Tax=Conoideocrella luteorostrata TaxID=1105319 RepID=A0AAJ0CFV1_9HYPO|nr:hypothetical protein QQS21_010113 [Conoideocrella luteorostrata]